MNDGTEIRFLGDLQKLTLNPSDVLVFKLSGPASREQVDSLLEYIEGILPGQKTMILPRDVTLGVLERRAA